VSGLSGSLESLGFLELSLVDLFRGAQRRSVLQCQPARGIYRVIRVVRVIRVIRVIRLSACYGVSMPVVPTGGACRCGVLMMVWCGVLMVWCIDGVLI
jgi:hypothetical protein